MARPIRTPFTEFKRPVQRAAIGFAFLSEPQSPNPGKLRLALKDLAGGKPAPLKNELKKLKVSKDIIDAVATKDDNVFPILLVMLKNGTLDKVSGELNINYSDPDQHRKEMESLVAGAQTIEP